MGNEYAIGMYAEGRGGAFELLIRTDCPWEDQVSDMGEEIARRLGFDYLYTAKQEPRHDR